MLGQGVDCIQTARGDFYSGPLYYRNDVARQALCRTGFQQTHGSSEHRLGPGTIAKPPEAHDIIIHGNKIYIYVRVFKLYYINVFYKFDATLDPLDSIPKEYGKLVYNFGFESAWHNL